MPPQIESASCANCSAVLYEGQSAVYDELTDEYYCDKACHADWLAENIEEYQRKHVRGVDL